MTDQQKRAMEFEEAYAKRSGVSVAELRRNGQVVATCDCGAPNCKGFQIMSFDEFNFYKGLGSDDVLALAEIISVQHFRKP